MRECVGDTISTLRLQLELELSLRFLGNSTSGQYQRSVVAIGAGACREGSEAEEGDSDSSRCGSHSGSYKSNLIEHDFWLNL